MPATCLYPEPDQSSPSFPTHFLKICLHSTLLSTPGSTKWSISLRVYHQTLYTNLLFPTAATCPTHLIIFDVITRIIFGAENRSLNSAICTLPHSPIFSSFSGPKILLSTLFTKTLSLRSSLNVSYQVSHPYKTTGTIIVLYILSFTFMSSKLEDKRFCAEWQQAFPEFNPLLIFPEYNVD